MCPVLCLKQWVSKCGPWTSIPLPSENLLEIPIKWPHPRATESDALGNGFIHLHFNKPSRWFSGLRTPGSEYWPGLSPAISSIEPWARKVTPILQIKKLHLREMKRLLLLLGNSATWIQSHKPLQSSPVRADIAPIFPDPVPGSRSGRLADMPP